ncbi:glycosyltransferase family 9 protein [Sungkyunkwania multivorans]|uniref:Glycosyltransferase family 9 protein n=1 Tax=Sungkyunkwania multivorans TaxID=1173618 RepID=A0ABW3CZA1_9FLAO
MAKNNAVSKHILVIRLSAMGDVAMTVPVIQCLVEQHPDVKITILSRSFFKPMFYGIPNVVFYEADVKGKHKGVFGLFKLYKELKKLEVDAVADLHNVLRSNILKFFFRLGGFKVEQIDKGREEKKALTASKNKVFKQLTSTHQRYQKVFEKLNLKLDISKKDFYSNKKLKSTTALLLRDLERPWIGIAPFAAFKGKEYPLNLMEEVIEALNSKGKSVLLFGGGKAEQEKLDVLAAKYKSVMNITGKLTFEEELQVIANLKVMVAMDSGNAHLAAMKDVKTITLWGVTHPYAGFYPYGQDPNNALLADREQFPLIPTSIYGNKAPEGYEKAIATIQPVEVIEKIESLIKK